MTVTAVSLVDGDREMILAPRTDIRLQEIDAPFPDIREEVDDETDDDGTDDNTAHYGARAVSLKLLALSRPRSVEDELSRFSHPRSRPYLLVDDDEWDGSRRLRLRVDQQSKPIGVDLAPTQRLIQAQWKAPDGAWEAVNALAETVLGDLAVDTGRTYPKTYPWSYPTADLAGAAIITNPGGAPSHFTAKLYGPCSGPSLRNETTGEQIAFTRALALDAGEYVQIDTRARSAYLLGNDDASRLDFVDFGETSWWQIEPGDQQVRYAPLAGSSGTAAVITYRPVWL